MTASLLDDDKDEGRSIFPSVSLPLRISERVFDEDVVFEFECEHDTSFSSGNWTLSFQPVPGLKTDGWLTICFAFRISRDGGFGPLLELEVAFKVDL